MALAQFFFATAATHRDKDAIVCDGARISYGDLAQNVARLSHTLALRGVKPGDVIGVLAHNSIEFVTLMLAAADCGAALAPLSPSLPADAIQRTFEASDVRHICAEPAALQALRATPFAHTITGLWFATAPASGFLTIEHLINAAPTQAGPLGRGALDAPYILTATSGSTGDPKAIVLTQRSKIARAKAAIELYSVRAADRVLAATPLYHSLAERLGCVALTQGATLVLMSKYTPSAWLACVGKERVSFTIAVSTQLAQIARKLREDASATPQCASLRCVVSSSAPLSDQDRALILDTLPGEFHECYGASEVAIATSLNLTKRDAPLNSVGRPAPGVEVRILDDSGDEAPTGETGEIACRTPMLFGGYHKRADITEAAMHDGFFKTGDIGSINESGALFYLGRKKELIITGGMNVYPADIEAAVARTPGVAECAAFSLPDAHLGEIVALAIVVTTPGATSARALRKVCAEKLADFQQPQRYVFLDALPRNAMGKLMRRALPALAQAQQEEAA